jgi:iron complex transport system substrate-binding protein
MKAISLRSLLALAACGCLSLTACSAPNTSAAAESSAAATAGAFPVSVASCDEQLSFTQVPSRVIMLGDTDASVLNSLGLLDKVVGRAGTLRSDAYDAATLATLQAIPEIKSTTLDTGGSKVSTEVILEQRADLVIGYDTGLDRAALKAAGVPLYSPDSYCTDYSVEKASFDLVKKEVTKVASIFGVQERATEVNAGLDAQITALGSTASTTQTIAALYITPGSKTFYAYGTSSMVQPIVEANGLRNIYDDQTTRVFDASMEDLLKRNPDQIVLLFSDGKADEATSTFRGFSGADELNAVLNNHVLVLPFSLTDPPSPLSIKGAVQLGDLLKAQS